MSGTHYIRKCDHGVVIEQCRCIDENKMVLMGPCPVNCIEGATAAAEKRWISPVIRETPIIAAIREAQDGGS